MGGIVRTHNFVIFGVISAAFEQMFLKSAINNSVRRVKWAHKVWSNKGHFSRTQDDFLYIMELHV